MTAPLDPSKIQKILIISLTNLGDIILTTPVISNLRCLFPHAHLSVVIGPKGKDLLTNAQTLNEVIIYDKKKMTAFQKLMWVAQLRKMRFDLVVDLRDTIIPYVIGAKRRTKVWHFGEPTHMRLKHLFRLKQLGLSVSEESVFDFFSQDEKQAALKKVYQAGIKPNTPVIAIAPGAGSYLKRWDVNRFAEVARFYADRRFAIAIVGSEGEKPLGETIAKQVGIVNLCGAMSLRELAAFLSSAKLLISCDSAIMHLGNELNIPVVSVFGPTDFKKYAKLAVTNRIVRKELTCAPCEKAHCRFDRQACMEDVTASDVTATCEELLK